MLISYYYSPQMNADSCGSKNILPVTLFPFETLYLCSSVAK